MKILDEVNNAKTIGISAHVNPDGDAIGACMGMYLFLKKALPGVRVDVFAGDFRESLKKNIPSVEEIRFDYATDVQQYDAFICLDTADDRLGAAQEYFLRASKKINIDHHVSNHGCGDVNYVEPKASSTSELVFEAIDETQIDEPIARSLYIGIVTDTGVFKYSNTSERTMQIAGKLLNYGFDQTTLIDETFYQKDYVQNQILGRALLESMLFRDGTCICSVIDRRTMDFYQATPMDMDGIVSQLMLTTGVKCAIFLYEVQPLTFKVSMRSNGEINVADIASFYGGGGHMRAAGCTVNAPYHDIINNISDSIDIQLQRAEHKNRAASAQAV